jgi:hypothetical protein
MHASKKSQALRGAIAGFNLSPKGVPEGIVLRLADGTGTAQVNFDPAVAGQVTAAVTEGQAVTIDAAPEPDAHADAAHPVFDLVRLSNPAGGDPLFVAGGSAEPDVSVRGQVVRLNHARRGEVNGGILDTGDFVHLRPHGVKAIGGLSVGQTLDVRGEVRPGWSGHRVIEARLANGIEIGKPPHRNPGGPAKHKPHGPKPKAAVH